MLEVFAIGSAALAVCWVATLIFGWKLIGKTGNPADLHHLADLIDALRGRRRR